MCHISAAHISAAHIRPGSQRDLHERVTTSGAWLSAELLALCRELPNRSETTTAPMRRSVHVPCRFIFIRTGRLHIVMDSPRFCFKVLFFDVMWSNSWFMERRRWPSHLFFGRWGRNALGCVTGSSFAACDCASAQALAWNIHEDSIRWAEFETLDWSWFARRASCVFNLLQESPWRFDSFRYFWIFLIGCVLFPCQVDHNLFLWYLRLPPAGVNSKDARHSLPALLAFMSPAMAFIPRNRDMLCWCESFPRGCGMQNVSTRLTIQQCYAGIPSKE